MKFSHAVSSSSVSPTRFTNSARKHPSDRSARAALAQSTLFSSKECVGSGIHSAIHGKIRSRDVGGFRTREKRRHCGDLLNMPIAIERGGGLLRYRPITRSGIQLRVDRTWLDVVDRDAPVPDLSG